MHLNKILEQIKRHQSPSEAIDKLSTALEKHEGSLLEKGFTILKSELAANMTEKSQIINMVRQSLDDCRIKKESLSKIDEEMRRCEDILKILNVNSDITTNVTKDFKELDELRAEVKELKQLLQNISTVRPEENNIDPPTEEKENEI